MEPRGDGFEPISAEDWRSCLTSPVVIGAWVLLGTVLVTFGTASSPFEAAQVLASARLAAAALVFIGAVAGLARRGWAGLAACVAGSAFGLWCAVLLTAYLAGVYQGRTLLVPVESFTVFAFAVLLGVFAAVIAGYALTTAVLLLFTGRGMGRGGGGEAPHGRARPARSAPSLVRVLATTAVVVLLSGAMAAWMGGTEMVLDTDASAGAVHRVTISPTGITVDSPSIPAGEVIWLATVVGDAPPDLTLLDESRRTVHGVLTPPRGSSDFVLARMTMLPGTWAFTAGYEGDPMGLTTPGPDGLPPLPAGRLVTRFEVTP